MVSKTFLKIPKKKQDRVLRAAQIEFAKSGYHKTNINDICRRARISNGALYKYFKNKADVYQAVIDRQVEGKDEYMRGVLNSEGPCIGKMRLLMWNTATETGARNDTFRILLQLGTSDMNKFAREVTRRIESTSFNNIRAILLQGIECGEVRPDIDLEMIAHLISSLCFFMYAGFVSEYHRIRLEEFFHIPFTGDEDSHRHLVDRVLDWLGKMILT
ncbi:TetR/AcrR family transcriptional regulator [Candidatus Poribacteria bacterium]|nr:TetR/AcrR family transcriptional regulator [Candidatus Poribacteria bacterium]